jgi:hypothetical protein
MGLLSPTRYVTGVCAVDLGALARDGKRALLLDRDNTLVPRDTKAMPPEVRAWCAEARGRGFKLCLVSNNWAKNVRPDAEAIGAALVGRAAKPLPFGIARALRLMGVRKGEAVLVGDQLFTDVLGGNLAGVQTILVVPQTTVDLAHTLVLRRLEALVLGGRAPEGAPQAPDDGSPR